MAATTHELALNCMVSSQNNLKKTKKMPYIMIATLFHGCSSKFEKHTSELDAKGSVNLKFKDVIVKSDYIRFQVLNRGQLFGHKHVGTINVRVSELVKVERKISQEDYATYELVKTSKKGGKRTDLNLFYKLSTADEDLAAVVLVPSYVKADVESKHLVAAIGNDIEILKMLPSFRTPFLSFSSTY